MPASLSEPYVLEEEHAGAGTRLVGGHATSATTAGDMAGNANSDTADGDTTADAGYAADGDENTAEDITKVAAHRAEASSLRHLLTHMPYNNFAPLACERKKNMQTC